MYTPKVSPTLHMNTLVNELERKGEEVFKFGFGQSPFPIAESIVNALKNNAHQKSYIDSQGLLPLRSAIADYHNRNNGNNFTSDQIVIGPGSKELFFLTQLMHKGTTLLPTPSWVSYAPQSQMLGKSVSWIPSTKHIVEIDLKAFHEILDNLPKEELKLLIINHPNNPTGYSGSEQYFKKLAAICDYFNVTVISDEIYADTYFGAVQQHSIQEFYTEQTIIGNGLSKWAGAGGWRLGYFIFPRSLDELKKKVISACSETFSCASSPIQYAAITAFEESEELDNYKIRIKNILKFVSNYIAKRLHNNHIQVLPASGGFYVFPNFENYRPTLRARGIETSDDLCNKLLEETGVALLSGSCFGCESTELLARLAYVDFDGAAVLQLDKDELDISKHFPKVERGIHLMINWLKK